MKSLIDIPEVKEWIVATALTNFPVSHKGNWAQNLIQRYSIALPKSEKTGKFSLTQKNIQAFEPSNEKEEAVKQFLLTGDEALLPEVEELVFLCPCGKKLMTEIISISSLKSTWAKSSSVIWELNLK